MITLKNLLFGILLLYSMTAKATTVSLDSCRQMAVKANKTIRMAEENLDAAAHYKKAAQAAYLPGIDFNATYMYNQRIINLLGEDAKLPTMSFDPKTMSYQYNLVTGADGMPVKDPSTGSYIPSEVAVIPKEAMSYDIHNVFAGAVTLTQPVYMGGEIRALNQIAGYGEKLAEAAKNSLTQDLIYAVDEAYWTVISLLSKKELAASFVNVVDTLLYNVKAMVDEGVATKSDLLSVEVRLNEARIAYTKVENGLSLSRMALAQLCGLPVYTEMKLEDEENEKKTTLAENTLEINFNEVYERRQDLEMVRQTINILKGREKLALGSMLPKIALIGAYGFSNPNVINGFEKRFGGGFNVGATLTVPIWHWGGDYRKYKAAKSTTNAQRYLLEDLEDKVRLQVTQAQYKVEEARKTLEMTHENLAKADENLNQARYGFQEGVLTISDVLMAQTAWLAANSENIDAGINLRLCHTYLEKVLGNSRY